MVRLYFVCMGNYYRSRLAEELAWHYAAQQGLELSADSGGLSKIPNPSHPGPIAKGTLRYLEEKHVQPRNATRFPKNCNLNELNAADIVILTDAEEQSELFKDQFPNFKGRIIGWNARDIQYNAMVDTLSLIDHNVQKLIQDLVKGSL